MTRLTTLGFLALACAMSGCVSKLETGYEPTKLGSMTPAERRGLYAQDFTPEAAAAQADQKNGGPGYNSASRLPGAQH